MWNSRNKVHCVNINITPCAEVVKIDQNNEIDIENLPVAKPSQPIFLRYIENEIRDVSSNIVVLIFCMVMGLIICTLIFISMFNNFEMNIAFICLTVFVIYFLLTPIFALFIYNLIMYLSRKFDT